VNPASVRALLERHGLRAHRDLGQNFLWDEALAGRLVELAGVEPGDAVIEIGTGLGTLTRALAARARRVITLEVDAGLVRALRAERCLPANAELRHADALETDLAALAAEAGAPVRLVANLPYAISAPLLRRLLDLRGVLRDWSVMVQREVAERLLAKPGSRDYGSLAVLHALCVELRRCMDLSPRCFHPVPRVRSSFVRVRPRADSPLAPGELARLERVLRAAFGMRRKMLANALREADLDGRAAPGEVRRALERLGLDPRARAEQLSPEQHLALARALCSELSRARAG
jgi:16S rRNA (adenine1518-N6/adenine1519-N6)-dimethyltransferase